MSFMSWKKSKGNNPEEHTEDGYFINYASEPPTLQHIAAVSIASRLWSEPDIKEDIRLYSESKRVDSRTRIAEKIYKEYEKRVLKKLADMLLPNKLKYKVYEHFLPVGLQLFKGFAKEIEIDYCDGEIVQNEDKEYCRFYDIFKMGGSVYWTMEGIIDNVTSLKELINNDDHKKDFYCLFELACKYCFEECVPCIWGKISHDKKNELNSIYSNYDYHIIAYWTATIENKLLNFLEKLKQNDVDNIYDNNLSIEQNMISLSIFVKNPYSLKYFWNKLKENERNVNLEKWLNLAIRKYSERERHEYQSCNDTTNNLCFLLSQLNGKSQQKEVFQAHSKVILKALFYNWPWQRFFLPTFCIILDCVAEETFAKMMLLISTKIRKGNEINEVFKEIWFKSSLKLKNSLIHFLEEDSNIIYSFIDMDDVETIFMILKYATEKESKQILFKIIESYKLFSTLRSRKLSLIDTLMTKYLVLSNDIDYFKYCVMSKTGYYLCKAWIYENDFRAIETLFAWSFKSTKEVREFKEKILDKNEIYSSLVHLGDYDLIDRFMNWCFENEGDICKFKKEFIHYVDKYGLSRCSDLLCELSARKHGWEKFEKFVNYNFCSPEEVTEFKYKFLESVIYFSSSFKFGFAQKFANWCLGSIDEVNRLKISIITSQKGMDLVVDSVNSDPTFFNPNELIKWLSMSKETAVKLKEKLNNIEFFINRSSVSFADYKRWALFYMLDKHAGSNNLECKKDSDSIVEDSFITLEILKAHSRRDIWNMF